MARLGIVVLAVALAGCGLSEAELAEQNGDSSVVGEELSAGSRTFVTLRHDARRCLAPLCGGYWVADVNRVTLNEQYVSGLDFSAVRFDDATIAKVLEAGDGEVVLHGKLGVKEPAYQTRKFVVSSAWRGMPGVKAQAGELFYSAEEVSVQCFAAPCPTMRLKKLNATATTMAHGLSLTRASKPFVDQGWLSSRVLAHGGLVAARFTSGQVFQAGTERLVDASQAFVKLPERAGPCAMPPIRQCPGGQVHTGARTVDRCVMLTACVPQVSCPQRVPPRCAEGYSVQGWVGGTNACMTFACDPTFVVE